jgi:ribosome-associated protein
LQIVHFVGIHEGAAAILAAPAAQTLRASISRVRPPDRDADQPSSKSARKREALDLQSLGEALIELPPEELDALDLPETLHDAIVAARDIASRGARVRQRQFIGKLMRKVDAEPIRAALARRRDADRVRLRSERHIEQWRDRLLTDDAAAWLELESSHPHASVDELRSLVRQARAERDSARPPAATRRLFRRLRELLDQRPPAD